jgi:hypothetical protein
VGNTFPTEPDFQTERWPRSMATLPSLNLPTVSKKHAF